MSFIETPRFPLDPGLRPVGGPEYKTEIVSLNSGWEQRNVDWDRSRARYSLEYPANQANLDTLLTWFRVVKGRGHGFRIRDWSDYTTTSTLVTVNGTSMMGRLGTTANGTGAASYQLEKYYAAGGLEEYRPIRKPVSGAVSVYRGGVLQTAGASAGNYAVDTTTGVITFVADAVANANSITPGATTTVVLATNPGTLIAGKLLYLSGFGSADAAFVNGIAHTINSVSGTGPFTFVLATNTLAKTITLGSGIGSKFAQTSDTLAWAGEFDVPVRFDTDYAAVEAAGGNVYQGTNFTLVEVRT